MSYCIRLVATGAFSWTERRALEFVVSIVGVTASHPDNRNHKLQSHYDFPFSHYF